VKIIYQKYQNAVIVAVGLPTEIIIIPTRC